MSWSSEQQANFCKEVANRFRSAYRKNPAPEYVVPINSNDGKFRQLRLWREQIKENYFSLEKIINEMDPR